MPLPGFARGGDDIRSDAPMTALVYDLQSGNRKALEDAYFNHEIDFFLNYRGVQNTVARELYDLREAGKAVESVNTLAASNFLRAVHSYPDDQLYIQGVIDAADRHYEDAMKIFKDLIKRRREISPRLVSLSLMAAARVAHEVGDYSQAIFYYSRVHQFDRLFFESVFEKSWSFYQQGDMNGALGATLTFMTPYSENVFYPEAYIVRAAAFYQLCLFKRANDTIEKMKKVFIPLQDQIKALQKRQVESWLFDERILKSVDHRLLGYMIADREFRSLERAQLSLQKEIKKLSGADLVKANEAFSFVRQRLAQRAIQVLNKAEQELKKAMEEADTIQIETLQLGVNVLTGAPVQMRDDLRTIQLGDVDFDEQIQFWPFHGEFWADELGSYYYGLKSQCH